MMLRDRKVGRQYNNVELARWVLGYTQKLLRNHLRYIFIAARLELLYTAFTCVVVAGI